jgi:apolipoprotein N-acyltransferase
VCIDSSYPSLIYKTNKNKPDYFVVLSNDSWFKNSFGVYNHNAMSVYMAVETGKYVLRCANTGITNIISPTGESIKKILPERKGYITYEK